jgi:hypothetical protein
LIAFATVATFLRNSRSPSSACSGESPTGSGGSGSANQFLVVKQRSGGPCYERGARRQLRLPNSSVNVGESMFRLAKAVIPDHEPNRSEFSA